VHAATTRRRIAHGNLSWLLAIAFVAMSLGLGCDRIANKQTFDAKAWSLSLRATSVRGWYVDGFHHEITDSFGETPLHPNSQKVLAPDSTSDAEFATWQGVRFTGVVIDDPPSRYYLSGVGHFHCARTSTPEGYCSYPVHVTFQKNADSPYFEVQYQETPEPSIIEGEIKEFKAYKSFVVPPGKSMATLLGSAKVSELEFKVVDDIKIDGVWYHCFVVSEKALGADRWERWCVAQKDPNKFFVDVPLGSRHQAIEFVILSTFRVHYSPIVGGVK
jgi:hypothetical protein